MASSDPALHGFPSSEHVERTIMAAISGKSPARIPIVAVTADRALANGLTGEFDAQVVILRVWPHPAIRAAEVLLLDLRILPQSRWHQLVQRSRRADRPEIVLIDDVAVPRTILACIAADVLVSSDTHPAGVVAAVRERTIESAFREMAVPIRADPELPYPLSAFLAAACMDRIDRVGTLAKAYGFKQSTLRNQWRACRPDSSVRLEDLLRELAHIRALAASVPRHEIRKELERVRKAWLCSAPAGVSTSDVE